MKRKSLLIVVFVSIFMTASTFAQVKSIKITNGEWVPFLGKTIKENGLASHIILEAFKSVGVKVIWGFFPWSRAFKLAEVGKEWDATAVWGHSTEREKDFYYSEPVVEDKTVFFYLKDKKFDWDSIDDLKGKNIGVTQKYHYGDKFEEARKNKLFSSAVTHSDNLNLLKLSKGRIELFPLNVYVGVDMLDELVKKGELKQDARDKIVFHPRPVQVKHLHLLISRRSPNGTKLKELIDKGIENLKSNGKLLEMNKKGESGYYK